MSQVCDKNFICTFMTNVNIGAKNKINKIYTFSNGSLYEVIECLEYIKITQFK